ncbi:hypothetical protein [Nocardia farcinica]|uniref:hypothetical protein n=1 Tax=Nocardia farcinica TaxID=37329 RepID=UPI0037A29796
MAQADEIDIARVDELPEQIRDAARLTVCAHAADAAEAARLLAMLGLIEGGEGNRKRVRHRGIPGRVMVPADAARRRVRDLRRVATLDAIVEATGVSRTSLSDLASGKAKMIRRSTEQAILDVTGIGSAGAA